MPSVDQKRRCAVDVARARGGNRKAAPTTASAKAGVPGVKKTGAKTSTRPKTGAQKKAMVAAVSAEAEKKKGKNKSDRCRDLE